MADQELFQLPEITSTSGSAYTYAIENVGGVYADRKINVDLLQVPVVDRPPNSPNSMDDEFTSSVLDSKWTPKTFSSGSILSLNSSLIYMTNTGQSTCYIVGVEQSISGSTSSWKFRCKFIIDGFTRNYVGAGIWVRDSVSGRILWFGDLHHGSHGYMAPFLIRANSFTSYNSEQYVDAWVIDQMGYVELEYNGSTFYLRHSRSGIFYTQSIVENQSTFLAATPTHVGIGSHYSAVYHAMSFDWFRRVA